MKFFGYLSLLVMTFCATCIAQEISVPSCSAMIQYIEKNLPLFGTLQNTNGFIYVDLDDEYVHKLISYIQNEGFQEPPYFGKEDLVGAHISVIYSSETSKYGVTEIAECGERISFVLKNCQVVKPPRWEEIDEVYFIAVDSPRLDEIRNKYNLPKREYDFHITIGVKPKMAKSA